MTKTGERLGESRGVTRRKKASPGTAVLLIFALPLFVLGTAAIFVYQNAGLRAWICELRLRTLPGEDYSPLVAGLYEEKRYDEAARLAAFAARYPDLPGQRRIAELQREIDIAAPGRNSQLGRGAAVLSGLLSGGGARAHARTGALLAGVLAAREVVSEAGQAKRMREEAGALGAALDAARLGKGGRWFPGAMLILSRAGLISQEYEKFLLNNARASAEAGQATAELQSAVDSTQVLVAEMGLPRALGVYREIRNDEDLGLLAMWSRLSADEAYILAVRGGVDILSSLPDTASGRALLTEIARKGERGIRSARFWLK